MKSVTEANEVSDDPITYVDTHRIVWWCDARGKTVLVRTPHRNRVMCRDETS